MNNQTKLKAEELSSGATRRIYMEINELAMKNQYKKPSSIEQVVKKLQDQGINALLCKRVIKRT